MRRAFARGVVIITALGACACGQSPRPAQTSEEPLRSVPSDGGTGAAVATLSAENDRDSAAAPAPAQDRQCLWDAVFEPRRGCIATKAWTPVESAAGAASLELEKTFRALPIPRDPSTSAKALELAVKLARTSPRGSERLRSWYREAARASSEIYARARPEDPALREQAAEAEVTLAAFDLLDARDALARRCPASTLYDLFGETPQPTAFGAGIAKTRVDDAKKLAKQLDQIAARHVSGAWWAIAEARAGIAYAQVYDALYQCDENVVVMFSAKELRFLDQLRNSGRPDLVATANDAVAAKKERFRELRHAVLEDSGKAAVQRLGASISLANATACSHDAIMSARQELVELRSKVGGDQVRGILGEMKDPTDPNHARTLEYVADWLADVTDAELSGGKRPTN